MAKFIIQEKSFKKGARWKTIGKNFTEKQANYLANAFLNQFRGKKRYNVRRMK